MNGERERERERGSDVTLILLKLYGRDSPSGVGEREASAESGEGHASQAEKLNKKYLITIGHGFPHILLVRFASSWISDFILFYFIFYFFLKRLGSQMLRGSFLFT
jgi:hypothetical protein